MEPGMIVFSYMMVCFIIIIILGFAILMFIRDKLMDKQLAKNILVTITSMAALPLLYRSLVFMYGLIYALIYYPERMFSTSLRSFLEQMLEAIAEAFILMIPVLAIGFLVAFLVVVPVTLISRRIIK